jgi:hypothetical protein
MLDARPEINEASRDAVIITVAVRGMGTADIRVPRNTYDPFALLDLLARHNGGQLH